MPFGGGVQAHPAEAVQDPAVGTQKVEIAGPAHQLRQEPLLDREAQLVGAVEDHFHRPLPGELAQVRQPGPQEVLAKEHTEHGGLFRIFQIGLGQVKTGRGGVRRDQELFPGLALQVENEHVPGGLVELFHPAAQNFRADLRQDGGEVQSVKGHRAPPFPLKTAR